jgi:6-phosphogluconolactonase
MTRTLIGAALAVAITFAITGAPQAQTSGGAVYTASNSAAGNQVLMFDRNAEGGLTPVNAFATGGTGSGNGLGNQGGVTLTADGKFLLVVNAGSHDVSVLETTPNGLILRDRKPSGGQRPISVTVNGRLVYVLNNSGASGGVDSVVGFRLSRDGVLTRIQGSTRGLSAASVGPAQVELSPDGASLVVTEKATSRIDIFAVDDAGLLGASNSMAAAGQTPFGFAFGKHDQFFVSEAFGGARDLVGGNRAGVGRRCLQRDQPERADDGNGGVLGHGLRRRPIPLHHQCRQRYGNRIQHSPEWEHCAAG